MSPVGIDFLIHDLAVRDWCPSSPSLTVGASLVQMLITGSRSGLATCPPAAPPPLPCFALLG